MKRNSNEQSEFVQGFLMLADGIEQYDNPDTKAYFARDLIYWVLAYTVKSNYTVAHSVMDGVMYRINKLERQSQLISSRALKKSA